MINKETEKQKSNAAQNPRTQRRRREKEYKVNQAEKNMKTQRSKSTLKISPRRNVEGKWQKEHD